MKVADIQVVFREFPDEITLALNISNCPCHCKGCHSTYLSQDIGEVVNKELLTTLIKKNPGITCVGLMGGDADPNEVVRVAKMIHEIDSRLKVGWYSGRDSLPNLLNVSGLDYIKLGHYDEDRGPLDNPNTNQRMYRVIEIEEQWYTLVDMTNLFWRKEVL